MLVFLAFYMVYGRKHSVVGKLQRGEITPDELPAPAQEH